MLQNYKVWIYKEKIIIHEHFEQANLTFFMYEIIEVNYRCIQSQPHYTEYNRSLLHKLV